MLSGIILFIIQFIKTLQEIGCIRFGLSSSRWEFDIAAIGQLQLSEDIVDHLAERIMRLPKSVQLGLQIAACIGSTFDLRTFEMADSNSGLSASDFLYIVTESGFIQEQDDDPGHYVWSHDQLREAAYKLIPLHALEKLHLLVGTRCVRYLFVFRMCLSAHLLTSRQNTY